MLLDWHLPHWPASETLARLSAARGDHPLGIIIMSGGHPEIPSPFPDGLIHCATLLKPFRMLDLIEAIHQAMPPDRQT